MLTLLSAWCSGCGLSRLGWHTKKRVCDGRAKRGGGRWGRKGERFFWAFNPPQCHHLFQRCAPASKTSNLVRLADMSPLLRASPWQVTKSKGHVTLNWQRLLPRWFPPCQCGSESLTDEVWSEERSNFGSSLHFIPVNFCTWDFANNVDDLHIFVMAAAAFVDAAVFLAGRVLFTEHWLCFWGILRVYTTLQIRVECKPWDEKLWWGFLLVGLHDPGMFLNCCAKPSSPLISVFAL